MVTFKQFFTEAEQSNMPSVLYHVTKASNVDSILKNGLEPRKVQVPGLRTRTPRIYLFSSINSENIDMIELFQHQIKSMGGFMRSRITIPPKKYEDVAVFKVKIPKGIKLYKDPLVNDRASNAFFVANKSISPEYLELVYTGPLKSKKDKSLKGFIKSYGIEGEPYSTSIIISGNKTEARKAFKNLMKKLQEKAGNKEVEIDLSNSLSIFSLNDLEYIKFWKLNYGETNFNTDQVFRHIALLYKGVDGNMTSEFYKEGDTKPRHYSLGVNEKELIQIIVNKLNGIVTHSQEEQKEAFNELITKTRRPDLVF